MRLGRSVTCAVAALLLAGAAAAQPALSGDTIHITRASGPITIDGDLSDPAWRTATRIDKWYETKPGDNTEPKVRNVGYLTFDDRYFYAAFEFDDPDPRSIRAPFADRDNINGNYNDYGGLLLDARNTGSNSVLFVATPSNTQYDSIIDDSTNEDSSPDFFWDSATKINDHGWTLEMRIPFSSIRYKNVDPQAWRVMLYRNYPRDFHYQFFSARLPRDGNCFVCRANVLTGLEKLPGGGHIVVAPYAAASNVAERSGPAGSPLDDAVLQSHIGVDVKYLPNADNAIDLTVKPDFSQIESDTAQIATNQRFALFYPEKRPFFLEGIDLFATPIQAVYTRTITDPVAGGRVTGKTAGVRYTVLVAEDDGGGSAIIPGPTSSSLAPVDFGSTVFIARAKRDLGLSFISVLATDREHHGTGVGPELERDTTGHNRVVGPDFTWRPSGNDVVTGQWLYSNTTTPDRPDLSAEWTGQTLTGHDGVAQWNHNTTHLDWSTVFRDISHGFRADTGFVPQVGYREVYGETGWTFRPTNFLSRLRTFVHANRQIDASGELDQPRHSAGRRHGHQAERLHAVRLRRRSDPDAGRRPPGPPAAWLLRPDEPEPVLRSALGQRQRRTGDRLRQLAPGQRSDDQSERVTAAVEPPRIPARGESPAPERERYGRAIADALHGERVARQGHLHIYVAHVRAWHCAISVNRSRCHALHRQRQAAIGHVQRVRAAGVQTELAIRHVRWVRGRPGTVRPSGSGTPP